MKKYNSIELFAGAGGMALGFDLTNRFNHILLNEFDKRACQTLKVNKPEWNILAEDISNIDFTQYKNKAHIITGGFPCQAFSYSGKKAGFGDPRGTLFFEYMRAVKEVQPEVFLFENVRGLKSHEGGKTFETMLNYIKESGYTIVDPEILNSVNYEVPQKRERIFVFGVRNDIKVNSDFKYPNISKKQYNIKDTFFKGDLYDVDVPESEGNLYSENRLQVMKLVPEGGNWRQLPIEIQKSYLGKSYYSKGGRTGIAKRLSYSEPSPTILCSPSQKQTERCHPKEDRPLTVRESARVQTFPDYWEFEGSKSDKYKQIGNAVPVNLAKNIAFSIIDFLDSNKI